MVERIAEVNFVCVCLLNSKLCHMDVTSADLVVSWVEGRLAVILHLVHIGRSLGLSRRGPRVWWWGCGWLWGAWRLLIRCGHLLWLPSGSCPYFLVIPLLWELASNDYAENLEEGDDDANSADKPGFIADKLIDLGVAWALGWVKKVLEGQQHQDVDSPDDLELKLRSWLI